jgi:hypothetical protein
MYHLDNNTGVSAMPAVPAVISPSKKFFTNGGNGVSPSVPEDYWFNMVQEELLGVLTMAGITPDKNDLGQVAKAIQSIAFSAYPVGSPIPWSTAVPPAGFLAMTGQSFSLAAYPQLAIAYPAGVIPDLRGEFLRGWDSGRGVDPGRTILSAQVDTIRNITGEFGDCQLFTSKNTNGVFLGAGRSQSNGLTLAPVGTGLGSAFFTFDASRVVPVSSENRPRNIPFNYIVRAA